MDYGGLFFDDVLPGHAFAEHDHRLFRPDGWIDAGRERMERMRPIAERAGLSMIQLACAWNLAHEAVECAAPTLIQEPGEHARAIEEKRADVAGLPPRQVLGGRDVGALRAIGDNTGSMSLKGASPEHEGPTRPDRWPLTEELELVAERFGIDPRRDLAQAA